MTDPTHALVTCIYEAALDPAQWEPLMKRLLLALGCQRGLLGLSVDGRPDLGVQTAIGLDPDLLQRWDTEFARFDPFLEQYGGRIGSTGTAVRIYDAVRPEAVRRTDVFRAIYEPMGIDDHLITVLGHEAGQGSFFAAYRGMTEIPFNADECALHRMLSAHLVMAARIHDRLVTLGRARDAQESVIARLPYGLVWLDDLGRVLSMNPVAERLIARRDGLCVHGGRLEARAPKTRKELDRAIHQAIALATGGGEGGGGLVRIERDSLDPAYPALVAPISGHSRELTFGFETRPAVVAIAISDPDTPGPLAAETLRRLFGLTPALSRLAVSLCNGQTLGEYAEASHLTIGTVRQQMKDLMGRVDARRQADVVRIILTSVARLRL